MTKRCKVTGRAYILFLVNLAGMFIKSRGVNVSRDTREPLFCFHTSVTETFGQLFLNIFVHFSYLQINLGAPPLLPISLGTFLEFYAGMQLDQKSRPTRQAEFGLCSNRGLLCRSLSTPPPPRVPGCGPGPEAKFRRAADSGPA